MKLPSLFFYLANFTLPLIFFCDKKVDKHLETLILY